MSVIQKCESGCKADLKTARELVCLEGRSSTDRGRQTFNAFVPDLWQDFRWRSGIHE